MKLSYSSSVVYLLKLLPTPTFGLYQDEAGINDFLLSSAGHGHRGVTYAQTLGDAVITSSSAEHPNGVLSGGGLGVGGCHVASRDVDTGLLRWRRNVCTTEDDEAFSVYTSKSLGIIYTNDKENVVRGWNGTDGSLLFDYAPASSEDEAISLPRLWGTETNDDETKLIVSTAVQQKNADLIRFYHPTTGKSLSLSKEDGEGVEYVNANDLLGYAKVRKASSSEDDKALMLGLLTLDTNQIGLLVGHASSKDGSLTSSYQDIALVQLSVHKSNDDSTYSLKIESSHPLKAAKDLAGLVFTSSIRSQIVDMKGVRKIVLVGISSKSGSEIVARVIGTDEWDVKELVPHPAEAQAKFDHISLLANGYVQISGVNEKEDHFQTLLRYNMDALTKVSLSGTTPAALDLCPEHNWLLSTSEGSTAVSMYDVKRQEATEVYGMTIDKNDVTKDIFILSCSETNVKAMITTFGGTTQTFSISKEKMTSLWSAEEALGSVTSTIFLDENHPPVVSSKEDGSVEDDDEDAALNALSFSSRINSQIKSLQSFVLSGGFLSSSLLTSIFSSSSDDEKKQRDYAFGFAKVAVLLSNPLSKLIAIDTADSGRQLWSMGLNHNAEWHKLLHGGPNGKTIVDATVGTHSHEILVLSYIPSTGEAAANLEWKCLDGTIGKTYTSSTSTSVHSPIAQITPLHSPALVGHVHEKGGCRQMALLLHEDDTMTVVPDTAHSRSVALDFMSKKSSGGKNGMFVHTVDKSTGKFRTMSVLPVTEEGKKEELARATTVGETTFNPSTEKIVNVVYPQRGEVIQTPASILGDDSLLLKYLNPHLAVVVTVGTDEFVSDVGGDNSGSFYKALDGGSGSEGRQPKKKPLGATKPGEEAPSTAASEATPPPTLFINLMDTVSGQILYRASHAHRDTGSDVSSSLGSSTNIPVVFTENWIIYAFPNARTRRTDIGVLSLHEGMIDKHGITAFTSPEQEMAFSSFESAKPIVLSKTYTMAKTVTALGVTTTKGGISMKQVLLATNGDQIISMDKRILDPRRPSGELKESEKQEGLMKYAPLLPVFTLRVPSYTQTVESVRSIVSTSAYVESQSLILAYGGPDIFFTRLAPSKGFDLLPDDFNRSLLAIVVLGLLVVMNTVKKMGTKKMVGMGWS